jgi:sarcosine oxidase subunit alpha
MTQPFRTASGGLIDRGAELTFRWDGRALTGYAGDTLASALLANGIRLVGRSFKYHRPRGIMAAGTEEASALVQIGEGARTTPHLRATEVPLYDGLVAAPVNCWPSLEHDLLGTINGRLSRFLAAGFYYKTFMWPHWHLFENPIRRAAGIGKVAEPADPDRYESRFAHCDVLVVGAGPAGLAAAAAAATGGARVILAEQDMRPGGALLFDDAAIAGCSGNAWVADTMAQLHSRPEATVLLRTAAIAYHDHNLVTLVEQVGDERTCAADPRVPRSRTWLVRAKRVVLATGAIERPLAFPGNDVPGIMLASASRHYARRFGVKPGKRAVVLTNNDDAYRTAAALAQAGTEVAAIVDLRGGAPSALAGSFLPEGAERIAGGAVIATRGAKALKAVCVRTAQGERWIECDHLAVSGGWNPTVHLFSQSGGQLRWCEDIAAFVPDRSVQAELSAGAAAGSFTTHEALAQGHAAGAESARLCGFACDTPAPDASPELAPHPIRPTWLPPVPGKAFVDLQNDVTVDDIALAARENFRSVEHMKRYTTLGMAPDQGKTANVTALAIMGELTGRTVIETGHTRYRLPYVPAAVGAFAGRTRGALFRPLRRIPGHARHLAAGAVFEDYGGWARPSCYPRAGESHFAAEQREALTVRTAAGLFEASPLGKIEVTGPDAGRFLDLVYANTMSTLKQGRVRYGLMLNELGVIIDDGVVARLAPDRFLVCTSSAGADRIAAWLEEWLQCEWPDLQVVAAPVTAAWGVLTLTGPHAQDILRAAGIELDLSDFPHMSFAETRLAGLPARVLRVSYTGEASYEINVPAGSVGDLWDALFAAGSGFGLSPVGIDAWMVLRTEKGYLHIGGDTDGSTSALDVDWGHIMKKSCDFIGKRSLMRPEDQRADRLQFVGLATDDAEPLPIGAHLVANGPQGVRLSGGYVTSSAFSPFLKKPVALGMVSGGRARIGEVVTVVDDAGRSRSARIVAPVFYDPAGDRLRG